MPATDDASDPRSFAVSALSRGKGVPPEAREALKRVEAIPARDRARGIAVRWSRDRYGIEGETKLCVLYEEREPAQAALAEVRKIVEGVDLIRLEIAPCALQEKAARRGTRGEVANMENEEES
jgi:hypothetical protein